MWRLLIRRQRQAQTYVLYGIIGVTCLITYGCWIFPSWMEYLVYDFIQAVYAHQKYRWLTVGFVHGNMKHLLGNMLLVYLFGRRLLQQWHMSARSFLALYLGSIIVGSIVHEQWVQDVYLNNVHHIPWYEREPLPVFAAGASGGVYGVVAATLLLMPMAHVPIPSVFYLLSMVKVTWENARNAHHVLVRNNLNIGHHAHMGGLLYGIFFACLYIAVRYFQGTVKLVKRSG